MIWGKKIWGRKRHALVDTQGNLLAVKVLGAEGSDQQGGRALLAPVKEMFPRMKLLWGDSHYGGTFLVIDPGPYLVRIFEANGNETPRLIGSGSARVSAP